MKPKIPASLNWALEAKIYTSEMQLQLLREVACGNKRAENELIMSVARPVLHLSLRFSSTRVDVHDLFSVGLGAAHMSFATFDPIKSDSLTPWALLYAKQRMLNVIRAKRFDPITFAAQIEHLDQEGEARPDTEGTLIDPSASADDVLTRVERDRLVRNKVMGILRHARKNEREIIKARYLTKERSGRGAQKEVAEKLGQTGAAIYAAEKRILARLRKALEELDLDL